jgi:hypothetical protein
MAKVFIRYSIDNGLEAAAMGAARKLDPLSRRSVGASLRWLSERTRCSNGRASQ